MNLKKSPQKGGQKRITQGQLPQYFNQTLSKQVENRIQLEQEGDIAQKKKKGFAKTFLKYAGPALGTGAAAGIPFLF